MTGPLIVLVLVGLVAIAIHAFAVMRFVQVTRDLSKGVLKPTSTVGELVGGVGIAFLGLTILVT